MKTKFNFKNIIATAMISFTAFSFNAQQKLPLSVTVSALNPTCAGSNNGEIVIDISGGFLPYTLNGIEISGTQVIMGSLTQGNYEFNVSDVSLASASGSVTLVSPQPLEVTAVIGNVSVNGGNDGFIDVTIVNQLPVTFEWSTLEPIQIPSSVEDQQNLIAGIYVVKITETNGCETIKRFILEEPANIFIPNTDFETPEVLSNTSND